MTREEFEDRVTSAALTELKKIGIDSAVPYFPMLRVIDDKLYLGTLIDIPNEELYKESKCLRPRYWILLNINDFSVIELNKTEIKDYMDSKIIPIDYVFDDEFKIKSKELSSFENIKKQQYSEYLIKDMEEEIKESQLPIINRINNKIIIDNKFVSAYEYLKTNIEDNIKVKVDELVDIIIKNKYSEIIYYYVDLIMEIIDEYKKTKKINKDKIILAANIVDEYYGKNNGIKYFFNIR